MSGIQDKVDAYSDKYDTDVVCYFGDIEREEDAYLIRSAKHRERRKNVLLLLSTYGGDANAAYRIARCFQEAYKTIDEKDAKTGAVKRSKCGTFSVYVDSVCKSAGTIICLGANAVIMSGNAELGPIDAQLRKQDEVGERTSGLTPIQSMQFLENQSLTLFKRHFRTLRFSNELGFSTKMAADLAARMTIGLLAPIYEQIDPIRLAEVDRSLRIAREYGDRLKDDNLKDEALDRLLAAYPSHGFVIDRKEAREQIFSNILEPTDEQKEIMELFEGIARMTLDRGDTFVYYLSSQPAKPTIEDMIDVNPAGGVPPSETGSNIVTTPANDKAANDSEDTAGTAADDINGGEQGEENGQH